MVNLPSSTNLSFAFNRPVTMGINDNKIAKTTNTFNTTANNDTNSVLPYHATTFEVIDLAIVSTFCCIAVIGNLLIILVKLRQSGVIFVRRPRSTPLTPSSKRKLSDLLSILLAVCDIAKAATFFVLDYPRINITVLSCSYLQRCLMLAFSLSNCMALILMFGRYRAICRPLEETVSASSKRSRKIVLVVIFIAHILVFFGLRKLFLFHDAERSVLRNCLSADWSRSDGDIIVLIEFVVLTLAVVSSVAVMSFYIVCIVRQLSANQPTELASRPKRRREQNVCAVKIIASIYIAYTTSFIPWVCLYLIGTKNRELYIRLLAHPASFLISGFISGSFCNSFLTYLRYSSTFRKDLRAILLCKANGTMRDRSVRSTNEN